MQDTHPVTNAPNEIVYEYRENGRRPLTVIALIPCVAMLAFAIEQAAPWWALAPIVFAVAGLGWMVVFNPVSGTRMSRSGLFFRSGYWSRLARLEEMASFEIVEWSEGGPSGKVIFNNGESLFVPSVCMTSDPAYAQTLRDLGVLLKGRSSCMRSK